MTFGELTLLSSCLITENRKSKIFFGNGSYVKKVFVGIDLIILSRINIESRIKYQIPPIPSLTKEPFPRKISDFQFSVFGHDDKNGNSQTLIFQHLYVHQFF